LLLGGNNWVSHDGPFYVNDDEDPAGSDTTLWDSPELRVVCGWRPGLVTLQAEKAY